MVKAIPDGYSSVTPYFAVRGANELVEFLKQAFGAEPRGDMMMMPDGSIGHGELKIGDSVVMVGEAPDEPVTAMLHLYVEDCDAVYQRALDAGAESLNEPTDQFYGDRSGGVRDKWGNQWYISTHVEDVTPDEMRRRAEKQFGSSS
jgi:uncharacterized glyoxalase superfamily protein PhnB